MKELETERRKTLNGETKTKVENNTPTAEDYEALRQELEAEKQKAAQLVEEATKPLQERIADLEDDMTRKVEDLDTLEAKLATVTADLEGAKAAYAYAVDDYKKLVLASNPLFTIDIITGDTIDDVKTSVEKAGFLVNKVKEGLEAQAKALAGLTTVPAGAPARTPQNTEGLSTKEKINLGLEQARKKKE